MSTNKEEATDFRPSGLIFDCDGTLADTMPVHFLAWRETMQRYGIEFTEDRFYEFAGMPSEKIINLLATEQGVALDAADVAAEKERGFEARLDQVRPIDEVTQIVRQHQGELPMTVGSGSTRALVLRILDIIGLSDSFMGLVASEDTSRHKPEPDVFLKCATIMQVAPEECLVYEDGDLGIEAARRAGMKWFDVRTVHEPRRMT